MQVCVIDAFHCSSSGLSCFKRFCICVSFSSEKNCPICRTAFHSKRDLKRVCLVLRLMSFHRNCQLSQQQLAMLSCSIRLVKDLLFSPSIPFIIFTLHILIETFVQWLSFGRMSYFDCPTDNCWPRRMRGLTGCWQLYLEMWLPTSRRCISSLLFCGNSRQSPPWPSHKPRFFCCQKCSKWPAVSHEAVITV